MDTCKVYFCKEDKFVRVSPGTTILEAQRLAGLDPNAPCGGQGTCGKCMVTLIKGNDRELVKACQTQVTEDVEVETLAGEQEHAILAQGLSRQLPLDPVLKVKNVTIPKMALGKSWSQWERLQMAMTESFGEPVTHLLPDLTLASDLYEMLREGDTWQVVLGKNRVLSKIGRAHV